MQGQGLAWRRLLGAHRLPVPVEQLLEQPLEQPGKPAVQEGLERVPACLEVSAQWAPGRGLAPWLQGALPQAAP